MTQMQLVGLTGASAILCCLIVCQTTPENPVSNSEPSNSKALLKSIVFSIPGDESAEAATKKGKRTVSDSKKEAEVEYNKLTPNEAYVILRKGTERAFTGEYTDLKDPGTYICRRCNAQLYHSESKFESHCGWPSFDDEIKGAVKRRRETDGTGRIEIVCNNCSGHLGHVFLKEGYTAKNTRHCVNSLSMKFIAKGKPIPEMIKSKEVREREAMEAKEKEEKEAKEKTAKPTAEKTP